MSVADPLARADHSRPDVPLEEARRGAGGKTLLEDGCYFLAYGNDLDVWYEGTLRVSSRNGETLASGDLYAVTQAAADDPQPIGLLPPRGPGIPIFPIADYTYYLRVTNIAPAEGGFDLTFEAYRFCAKVVRKLDSGLTLRWESDGTFTARMKAAAAPPGYPAPDRFFVGEVPTNPLQPSQLQMGWVSPSLRKAVIEIDRVPDSKVPQDNYAGTNWQSIFQSFGWEVNVIVSNDDVTKKTSDPLWNKGDADTTMRARRDNANLDTEWRFYILVASKIFAPSEGFGYMYHPTREALFMTSQHVFPENEAQWGALRGKRFDTTVAFFRTAVHEMGHAMSLGHSQKGFGFMRPTETIAAEAPADNPFPANIDWSFAPDDVHRLRHWPDITVRPGGPDRVAGDMPLPGDPPRSLSQPSDCC